MHDSFTPLGGLVPLTNIMHGEVIFGGVGGGIYVILIFVVLAVFMPHTRKADNSAFWENLGSTSWS